MSLKTVLAVLLAMAAGAGVYALLNRKSEGDSPLLVMVTQMRTRAIIEHERQVTVWYKSCPEVPGINPQVMVIWPAKLNYEIDLAATQLELRGDVLHVTTPPIHADEPTVPTEVGEYMAQSSFWTLESDQSIVIREMQKASPLARHLTAYFLRSDAGLSAHFKDELEAYLHGIAGALGLKLARIDIEIPTIDIKIPPRPELGLCAGSVALANGVGFARRQQDGTVVGIYEHKPKKSAPKPASN